MDRGRPVFKAPFHYFAGFMFLFVVAHLHYVLLGINVFPVIGGVYFWFPRFTGRMMSERLGKLAFWVMFTGFNVAFFPMHVAGLRDSGVLLEAHVTPDTQYDAARILRDAGGQTIERATGRWQQSRWVDFDPRTPEPIAMEEGRA